MPLLKRQAPPDLVALAPSLGQEDPGGVLG